MVFCHSLYMYVHRLPNILEYLREPLQAGLGDRSAYVRKTAVMGIVKLFYVVPEFVTGMLLLLLLLLLSFLPRPLRDELCGHSIPDVA